MNGGRLLAALSVLQSVFCNGLGDNIGSNRLPSGRGHRSGNNRSGTNHTAAGTRWSRIRLY